MRKFVILAAAVFAASCDAPETDQTMQADADGTMTNQDQPMAMDSNDMAMEQNITPDSYVTRAAVSDMYEIQAGQLAINKGNSDMTREFGRMMVDDHSKSSRDMKAALANANVNANPPASLDAEHQRMIDQLQSASGEAFDREYVNQQKMAHRKALALHQSYAQNGDNAQLQAFARNVVPVIEKHHNRLEGMEPTGGSATGGAMGTGTTTGTNRGTNTSGNNTNSGMSSAGQQGTSRNMPPSQ